ncbi:MAG TPA: ankyrin repeat domain-containing protein [Ruminiclostridium sp.]
MNRIELYKPKEGKKDQVNKTIHEITDELEKRLESQGLKPDFSFLSADFKKIQKEAFPTNNNVSGMLSVSNDMVVATVSVMDKDNPEVKGRMLNTQYKINEGKATEAFDKATAALKLMVQSFWMNVDEKQQLQSQQTSDQPVQTAVKQSNQVHLVNSNTGNQEQLQSNNFASNDHLESNNLLHVNGENSNAHEVAKSIQKALANTEIANEYNKLQRHALGDEEKQTDKNNQEQPQKTITISTGAKALVDEKIVNRYLSKQASTSVSSQISNQDLNENIDDIGSSTSNKKVNSNSSNSNIKDQLINVNFTPEQAEVVIQLLEENQKKYEPKSSMFGLLGDVLGKMLHALSRKLDEMIDAEKITTEKINSLYSAINKENCQEFSEKYRVFDPKIKYCHDFICEAAQGQTVQSADIINQILNREKVPVSIRTLQNAFVTAIDNNLESALVIYKYADANLHGEAHFDTTKGFLSHALNTLIDNEAEKFIKASSFRTYEDTVIFKEMIRAEKYDLLSSSLKRCENIDEHAPSLFYFAAQRKDVDALHTLVSRGANVNANNSEALYTCFETNRVEAAKVLINYGSDIEFLRSRIEQIKRANPNNVVGEKLTTLTESNFIFLKDIYKYCGLSANGKMAIRDNSEQIDIKQQIDQEQQAEQTIDNESDEHDGSLG